ncbi:DM13 domain-containing protein [Virgisporangium aurantiacum]|uniref:DM13 domain-containing protein n=1 Tax=Virgisporangium aurantiacum TaxID=175570 RepID=A0A8J3Z4S0_9ACTN|nr:DM13 domain-containing protein [Virgisporangium aurantiacum]GIJ57526.1 hypothetical protein Vau01_050420 [Virgisporangium aurantiacum]
MTRRPPRKAVMLMVAVLAAVLAGYGLYWYAPWMRAYDTTVNDPLSTRPPGEPDPTRTNAVELYMQSTGTFVAQRHKTSGRVQVVLPEGRAGAEAQLELIDFETVNGPDLEVWLSDQPVQHDRSGWRVYGTGQHMKLGALKGNKGNQTYIIPNDRREWSTRSVVIWSARHDVAYGAAAVD